GFIREDRGDGPWHHVPGREDQPFGEPLGESRAKGATRFVVRECGRKPEELPCLRLDHVGGEGSQSGVSRVYAPVPTPLLPWHQGSRRLERFPYSQPRLGIGILIPPGMLIPRPEVVEVGR